MAGYIPYVPYPVNPAILASMKAAVTTIRSRAGPRLDQAMNITPRLIAALVAGCATAVGLALAGTFAARTLWPDYAAAEPEKTYSFIMLAARLTVGMVCTSGAACVTMIVARDKRDGFMVARRALSRCVTPNPSLPRLG